MRYVAIDTVEPGQFLGKTIYSGNGSVLLSEGVQLTVYMITTLKRIGVTYLFIRDANFADVEIVDTVSEETKRLVMQRMTEMFASLQSGKPLNPRHMTISVDQLIEEVMKNKEVLIQLSDIRTRDNEVYVHALNVCTVSVLIGINMGLNLVQLKELAIGALLHDVGKLEAAPSNEVDEEEDEKREKQHHTWRGFELLKNKREFNLLVAHVALQHHEQVDGGGMPRGVTGEHIHIYAKIVAAANMYDNLLFDLAKGGPMLPHEACEYMMAKTGSFLDHSVMIHFTRTVSIYPTGVSVRLSNKESGVVVGQHRGLPGRPIVRVVKRESLSGMEVKEVDLAKFTTLFVEAVIS